MINDGNPFDGWLVEVANALLVVDESEEGLSIEAHGNYWSFGISQDQARLLTQDDVLGFLQVIVENREQQLRERSEPAHPMVFYCWCDPQVSHLCFSLVSVSHHRLPFRAQVKEMDDLVQIVQRFLLSPYHDGLPLDEFVVQDFEDASKNVTPRDFVLPVWTKILPTEQRLS